MTLGAVAVSAVPSASSKRSRRRRSADNQGILVTIYLGGGNDGLNMVAPVADAAYAALRPTLKITNGHSIGGGLALHPSLTKLKARFDQGKVAVVRGVGYQPPDLSHFSSGDIWMHGWGGAGTPTTGWLGRFLDRLPNTAHESLYGVSLHGGVERAPRRARRRRRRRCRSTSTTRSASTGRIRPTPACTTRSSPRGNGASGLGALGDFYDSTEMELMLLDAAHPRRRTASPTSPTTSRQQLVLAAHLINANLGIRVIDTADRRVRHALRPARLARAPCCRGSTPRSTRSSPRWRRAGRARSR